jgi:hypothetical protein
MRGAALSSTFLLVLLAACTPAKAPPDVSSNDPSPSSSASVKSDEPSESWGSSETAEQAHIKSNAVTPPASSFTASTATASTTTAAPAADNGPHVSSELGGPAYDRAQLEVTLKRAARQVSANCGAATDDTGTASGPWGKTTITVKLGHNGHSRGGAVPPPFDGKTTGRCVVQAFTNLIYAPFAGADVDVDWPVEIKKP